MNKPQYSPRVHALMDSSLISDFDTIDWLDLAIAALDQFQTTKTRARAVLEWVDGLDENALIDAARRFGLGPDTSRRLDDDWVDYRERLRDSLYEAVLRYADSKGIRI